MRKAICVRCDSCDQLHMAYYEGDYSTAVGPQPVWLATCPVTGQALSYTADEEVQLP